MEFTNDGRSIRQRNGEIVTDALKSLNRPSTLTDVIKEVADAHQVKPSRIREPIKSVLQKGVEYGFIQKMGARYTMDLPFSEPSQPSPEDRSRRQRSRSRRRPKASRSRSKSRKRRSKRRKVM